MCDDSAGELRNKRIPTARHLTSWLVTLGQIRASATARATHAKVREQAALAHGEVFGEIRPATTILEVSSLIDPALLIEIEADAVLS